MGIESWISSLHVKSANAQIKYLSLELTVYDPVEHNTNKSVPLQGTQASKAPSKTTHSSYSLHKVCKNTGTSVSGASFFSPRPLQPLTCGGSSCCYLHGRVPSSQAWGTLEHSHTLQELGQTERRGREKVRRIQSEYESLCVPLSWTGSVTTACTCT